MSKFLVTWTLDISRFGPKIIDQLLMMPEYAAKMTAAGKLAHRYHLVGQHGGVWIYDVASNEELDRCLAQSPLYNFVNFTVSALAEMSDYRNQKKVDDNNCSSTKLAAQAEEH